MKGSGCASIFVVILVIIWIVLWLGESDPYGENVHFPVWVL